MAAGLENDGWPCSGASSNAGRWRRHDLPRPPRVVERRRRPATSPAAGELPHGPRSTGWRGILIVIGLEWYDFCKPGEAGPFLAGGHTRPGGTLLLNTNGGQLSESYM
ncbi:thiolase C-terminal domain-containing protein [Pseudonocardia sichuanensis]